MWRGDDELDLTKTEFDLLELLVRNAGIVLDHSTIYERIWNYDFGPDSKNLAVYIGYLRRKTEAGGQEPADPHRARRRLRRPHRPARAPTGPHAAAAPAMSLRWKIAIAVGAMAALATLAVGLLSYRLARDRMYAEIDVSLTEAVALVRDDDRLPDWEGRGPGPVFYQTQLLGPDGSVRLSTSPAWEPDAAARSVVGRPRRSVVDTVTIGSTRYRVRTTGSAQRGRAGRPTADRGRSRAAARSRTRIIVLVVARHRGGHAARLADRREGHGRRCAA